MVVLQNHRLILGFYMILIFTEVAVRLKNK